MKPDLFIVGGGPGGGLAALLAARRGMRVQLIERKRFPRDKVCGEVFFESVPAVMLDKAITTGIPPVSK